MVKSFGKASDVTVKYRSERTGKDVEITVDNIGALLSDTHIDYDDVKAVRSLLTRISTICKNERLGTVDFCADSVEKLRDVKGRFETITREVRLKQIRQRRFFGSNERTQVISAVEQTIIDLDEALKDKRFKAGIYE